MKEGAGVELWLMTKLKQGIKDEQLPSAPHKRWQDFLEEP